MVYSCPLINDNTKPVDTPNCMYKVDSVYTNTESSSELPAELQQLAARQTNILSELKLLENEVKQLSSQLGHKYADEVATKSVNNNSTAVDGLAPPTSLEPGKLDFVVSMSPEQPSFSPMLISAMLKAGGLNTACTGHVHSSQTDAVPDSWLRLTAGRRTDVPDAKVLITYIWKKDELSPSLMYSPLLQTRLQGDASIARYLSRLLAPCLYDETDVCAVALVDRWLDNANQLCYGGNKEREASMKSLNAQLGKHVHVCGNKFTIADVVTLNSLVSGRATFKTLPKNVKRWFGDVCCSRFASLISSLDLPTVWLQQ